MKVSPFILFISFFLSCSNHSGQSSTSPSTELQIETSSPTSERLPPIDYPKDQAAVQVFPGIPYQKVIAYELNGRYGHARAASVFENRTKKQVVLTKPQVEEFLSLLNDRKSYGYYEMACFDPRIGLVFYNVSNEIVAYLSLCLQCNNVRSEPALDFDLKIPSNSGFTKKKYRQLLEMFNAWGIPHEHKNPFME